MTKERWLFIIIFLILSFIVFMFVYYSSQKEVETFENTDEAQKEVETFENTNEEQTEFLKVKEASISTWIEEKKVKLIIDKSEIEFPLYDNRAFRLDFSFNYQLDKSTIESSIIYPKFKDIDFEINDDGSSFTIFFRNVGEGQEFPVTIKNDLKSTDNLLLQNDLTFKIVTTTPTMAEYKLIGVEETLELPWGAPFPEENFSEPKFTNQPKKLEIYFTDNIDKESVETVIKKNLKKDEVDYTFNWIDLRTLSIDFINFKKQFYGIPLGKALDKKGFPIKHDLYFSVYPPNELFYWDIEKDIHKKIKTFNDTKYISIFHPFLSNYLLIANQGLEFVYNLEKDEINILPENPGIPDYLSTETWSPKINWIDESTIVYYLADSNTIVSYSFEDGLKTLVYLKDYLENINVMDMAISPNGKEIAVANAYDRTIYIFSTDGDLIYETESLNIRSDLIKDNSDINLGWLNNDIFFFEGYAADNPNQINIYTTEINMDVTEIFLEKAFDPHSDSSYLSILYRKYEEDYNKDGEYHLLNAYLGSFEMGKSLISNFHMIDKYRMIYNQWGYKGNSKVNEIILFNLENGEKKKIAEGTIVGLSPDKTRVYYMKNQVSLFNN